MTREFRHPAVTETNAAGRPVSRAFLEKTMLTTTVVLLVLAAPVPAEPDRYAHPVTGKRIETVPKVVIEADPNKSEVFCCLATLALHQGKKLDRKTLDVDKKDDKLVKDFDAMVAYFKKHDVAVARQEGKANAIKAIDALAKDKKPVVVFVQLKMEFEWASLGVSPLYPVGVILTNPAAGRGMSVVCLLYVDPDTIAKEERYVCIQDSCYPGRPEWVKYQIFMENRLPSVSVSNYVFLAD